MTSDTSLSMAAFSFEPELGPGHVVLVPSLLLLSADLAPLAKLLYCVLLYYSSTGTRHLPSTKALAEKCAVTQEETEEALDVLISAGLLTRQETLRGQQLHYHVCAVGNRSPSGRGNKRHSRDKIHIPLAQPTNNSTQIQQDSALLIEKLGISKEAARSLAQLAAERGCSRGYVAEVVEYALTTPGIKNPAGCAVELIKRNESRRPLPQVQEKEAGQGLDPEKYTTGKYAFLFRPGAQNRDTQSEQGERDGEGEGDDL